MGIVTVGASDAAPPGAGQENAQAYLVGGGIASMAAAAFMIHDVDILGREIIILEELRAIGSSLDNAGSADCGYVLRDGRTIPLHLRPVRLHPAPRRARVGGAGDRAVEPQPDGAHVVHVPPGLQLHPTDGAQVRPQRAAFAVIHCTAADVRIAGASLAGDLLLFGAAS